MSDTATEKETEIVAGTITAVTQKKADTWQVEVKPDNSQYTKKLWTKDAELVTSLTQKLGQAGAFVCGASYWTNQGGKEIRSLWINSEADGLDVAPGVQNADVSPSTATPSGTNDYSVQGPQRPPVLGGDKDRLIVRQTCIKAAAELVAPGDDIEGIGNQVIALAGRFEKWVSLGLLEEYPFR